MLNGLTLALNHLTHKEQSQSSSQCIYFITLTVYTVISAHLCNENSLNKFFSSSFLYDWTLMFSGVALTISAGESTQNEWQIDNKASIRCSCCTLAQWDLTCSCVFKSSQIKLSGKCFMVYRSKKRVLRFLVNWVVNLRFLSSYKQRTATTQANGKSLNLTAVQCPRQTQKFLNFLCDRHQNFAPHRWLCPACQIASLGL